MGPQAMRRSKIRLGSLGSLSLSFAYVVVLATGCTGGMPAIRAADNKSANAIAGVNAVIFFMICDVLIRA